MKTKTQTQTGSDTGLEGVQYLDDPDDKRAVARQKVTKVKLTNM